MQISTLVSVLDKSHLATEHLAAWRLVNPQQGQQVLLDLAELGLTLDLLASISRQLAEHLPRLPNPDQALRNFGRYLQSVRSPLSFAALLERDRTVLPTLIHGLSLGPAWVASLIQDTEAFDLLRGDAASSPLSASLVSDLQAEIAAFYDERSIIAALARFWSRQRLRIALSEASAAVSLENAQRQLADVYDAMVAAGLTAALAQPAGNRLLPKSLLDKIQAVVFALGDFGSRQGNFSSPVELLLAYDAPADAQAQDAVHDYVDKAARLLGRWLADATTGDSPAHVRLLALPDSPMTAAAAHVAEDVVIGFDSFGRTWHRQQMLKARPMAGDLALGKRILSRLENWLFRRYLNHADETGIKALKRRILVTATLHQDDWRSPRLARGGIRDIEATVEWLQLLVGGEEPLIRTAGTLAALQELAESDAVAPEEQVQLAAHHIFFCRLEHLCQIYLDRGELPSDDFFDCRIAGSFNLADRAALEAELRQRQVESWQILRRLLNSAFPEDAPPAREVELLLDPDPPEHEIRAALAPFGFALPQTALRALNDLAAEQISFLSTRRCRHLLSTILPRLLTAISATPSPDATLANLVDVSNSLGGKGILWELLRSSPVTLDLYVKICAASPYLSSILTTNPGMIDELVDSLQLDRLPSREALRATLAELCRGANDTLPVLHDFKNAEHLAIGVRDILGKEGIDQAHAALADVAETCLEHIVDREFARLTEKYGKPTIGLGPFEGEPCGLVIVGLGKLGGREPNYHSHLDLLLFYEAEGTTRPPRHARRIEPTTNNHFFTQLAQRVTKLASELTPKGRLYTIDMPLRPIGISGALALTFDDLSRHFREGAAQLWQWQVLCQARPIQGSAPAQDAARNLVEQLLRGRPWDDAHWAELRRTRLDLERGASADNLKRGPGGTLDVEFLVQALQLKWAATQPAVLVPNTQQAITALVASGALSTALAQRLGENYRNLRRVESGLRLLNASGRHDLPSDGQELAQLAYLLGHTNSERLRSECHAWMADNRAIFEQFTATPDS